MDFDDDPNYFDLDDILAHSQKVNVKFLLDIPGLEITEGTELMLPYWLAKTMYTYSMIDIEFPKAYNEKSNEVIEAEADVVNLYKKGPHYYRFGKLLMELKRERGNDLDNKYRREPGQVLVDKRSLAINLINTFHSRRHKILKYSTTKAKDIKEVEDFEKRLDSMERKIYEIGRNQLKDFNKWKQSH